MAKDTRLVMATAIAACNTIVDSVDAGAGAGKLIIYSGAQVAVPGDAEGLNTDLVTFTLNDPAFGAAATDGGSPAKARALMDVDPAITATPTRNGTAGHFVFYDSDDNPLWDGTCGTTNADLILDSLVIDTGVDVTITSFAFRMPTETTCP